MSSLRVHDFFWSLSGFIRTKDHWPYSLGESRRNDPCKRYSHLFIWSTSSSFRGACYIAYIPRQGKVYGLSKLARVAEVLSRRPQLQERLTSQIADTVEKMLGTRGVLVVIEAEHMCMTIRGIKKPGSRTITSALRGIFKANPATRAEAFSLIK